jgi:hypothetical protein
MYCSILSSPGLVYRLPLSPVPSMVHCSSCGSFTCAMPTAAICQLSSESGEVAEMPGMPTATLREP